MTTASMCRPTSVHGAVASHWMQRYLARSCVTSSPRANGSAPHDGAALREIGVEVSEQLDIVPQQVRVIRHERVKYACPCCDGGLRLAARSPQVIPKGLFTDSAVAWMITSKYLDGLPLYRQAVLLGRSVVRTSRAIR